MLTIRETATVLAALRHWQEEIHAVGVRLLQYDSHFEQVTPLTVAEIDDLCERLNFESPTVAS